MTVAYQLPVRTELAKKVGPKLWWKPILRKGHIEKGGIELDVDDALFASCIQSFQAGAKDQVQFLAGHADDSDLEAFRGDLKGLEVRGDLLWGLFDVTDRADRMLEENPRLGASVAVVDRFERADGREFGPTLLHVAGTFDPEIGQLGDWVRAELSASKTQVVDLTAPVSAPPSAAPKGGQQSHPKETTVGSTPQLTDEELAAVRSVYPIFKRLVDEPGPDPAAHQDTSPVEPEFTEAELAAMAAPAELATSAATAEKIRNNLPGVDKPELVAAAAEHDEALELANARIDAQAVELAAMRLERDQERYQSEKEDLARKFGIPADVVELARPLLFGTGHTLELSAGKKVDPGQVMRKVLHELGRRYAKALDLGAEYGTADAEDDATRRESDLNDFVTRARAELGQ